MGRPAVRCILLADGGAGLKSTASLGHVAAAPSGNASDTKSFHPGAPSSTGLRFQVLRPHAEGGLGKVSVALDQELRREVAFKEIKEKHADDAGSRSRFLVEAE